MQWENLKLCYLLLNTEKSEKKMKMSKNNKNKKIQKNTGQGGDNRVY